MYDDMMATRGERWAMLLDEADEARRARRAAALPRVAVRERVAATLIALARRIGPTVPAQPAPSGQLVGTR
jgi:hypothetical protein